MSRTWRLSWKSSKLGIALNYKSTSRKFYINKDRKGYPKIQCSKSIWGDHFYRAGFLSHIIRNGIIVSYTGNRYECRFKRSNNYAANSRCLNPPAPAQELNDFVRFFILSISRRCKKNLCKQKRWPDHFCITGTRFRLAPEYHNDLPLSLLTLYIEGILVTLQAQGTEIDSSCTHIGLHILSFRSNLPLSYIFHL